MKHSFYIFSGLAICFLAFVALFARVWVLGSDLRTMQTELARAKEPTPGLGEFMTTIQLHVGKLWFAADAENWNLARYELDELKETMDGAGSLHAVKNDVNVSNVLASVVQTQIAHLAESIKTENRADFQKAYDETRSACNGCHQSAGYGFIHIVRPNAPPVTNQSWNPKTRTESLQS